MALTVVIPTTEGEKTYLLDPTFKQFCTGDKKSPGTILFNLPDGEHITKSLKKEGFFEISPAQATCYLSAFHRGICPFSSEAGVMKFFNNTEDGRYQHGLWPPKSFLAEKGWIAKPGLR